jgi:hypothetical protein
MAFDLPLSCHCGRVRGVASEVAPASGFRFVCYCTDCQAFAHFLAPTQEPEVLDSAGGTEILQMPPGRVRLTAGADALRCLRLRDDTAILRWYADCCRTPIANTAGPRFPVIGLIHSFMGEAADHRTRDDVLGPPLCRIYERSAIGVLPPTPPPPSFAMFARRGSKLLGWWVRRLGRPNPFFDAHSGAPLTAPRVLTRSERAALGRAQPP